MAVPRFFVFVALVAVLSVACAFPGERQQQDETDFLLSRAIRDYKEDTRGESYQLMDLLFLDGEGGSSASGPPKGVKS